MKVLVINAGSSSLKYQLIEMDNESVLAKGVCDRIGIDGSFIKHYNGKEEVKILSPMPTHTEAIQLVLKALVDSEHGVIKAMDEIAAVGHRVLHSGEDFHSSVKITDDTLKTIEGNIDLGPLHMPPNIMGIKACRAVMKDAPEVAVFDTTFHSTMPDYAYMYAIRYDDYKDYKIRKYGFHGSSHAFISQELEKILGKKFKAVICHLGNGASISAVVDGKCVDTSMGLTPLEGLVMGTRSGDIDPAVIEYLMSKTGMDIHEATNYLNKKCGLTGISGISSDFRDLMPAMESGHERATLAVKMFTYRVKKYIGSYAAAMGGLDAIAFTGGIGEHIEKVREMVTSDLQFLGAEFDAKANCNVDLDKAYSEISTKNSKVKVFVIPTNEELYIARETLRLK